MTHTLILVLTTAKFDIHKHHLECVHQERVGIEWIW